MANCVVAASVSVWSCICFLVFGGTGEVMTKLLKYRWSVLHRASDSNCLWALQTCSPRWLRLLILVLFRNYNSSISNGPQNPILIALIIKAPTVHVEPEVPMWGLRGGPKSHRTSHRWWISAWWIWESPNWLSSARFQISAYAKFCHIPGVSTNMMMEHIWDTCT